MLERASAKLKCEGKELFPSPQKASRAIRDMQKREKFGRQAARKQAAKLTSYYCKDCGGFHIGYKVSIPTHKRVGAGNG